jgi:hypothetical protein
MCGGWVYVPSFEAHTFHDFAVSINYGFVRAMTKSRVNDIHVIDDWLYCQQSTLDARRMGM